MNDEALAYYAAPGRFTRLDAGEVLTTEVKRVVEIVQGLLIYDVVAEPFYGVELEAAQLEAIHERDTQRLLALVRELDPRPLDQHRPPAVRVGARCHTYSRVTVAFLRDAGIPARARCGFGAFFRPGWLEDHWVAEYWDEFNDTWQMVEAQLDANWLRAIDFKGDPLHITPSEFVTAGMAWQRWRRGELDASRCGLSGIDEHGAHWIAGNLRLDFASLNKIEMLPWDVWGAGLERGEPPREEQLHFFDTVAELTANPDTTFGDLRHRYETDQSLQVPDTVFNALRQRFEAI